MLRKILSYLSYYKIKLLLKAGILPKELYSVDPLICLECAYDKSERKLGKRQGS